MDIISSLPDEVLAHILSFMSTKEAVQTCILAKRWRNVWASVPVLYFSLNHFWKTNDKRDDVDHEEDDVDNGDGYYNDDDDDVDDEEYEESFRVSENCFMRFVDGVVKNRGPSHLEKVIYCWSYESNDYELGSPFDHAPSMRWLHHVGLLMPSVINVHIEGASFLHVPDSVFCCASLQKVMMRLYSDDGTFLTPKSINLPSLKTLELDFVEFDDNFVRMLFLGCPALESVKLNSCNLDISTISSNTLKMLTLHACNQYQPLRIICPALVSLSITNISQGESISLQNTTSLVNADITLSMIYDHFPLPTLNLLNGLSNATHLKLDVFSPELKEQLDKDIPNCRTFRNLKSLEIGACDTINLIACFLQNSANLEELTLELLEYQFDTCEEPIQKVAGDLLFHIEYLDTLKIRCETKEFAGILVKLLGRYIKTIGNIIVDARVC